MCAFVGTTCAPAADDPYETPNITFRVRATTPEYGQVEVSPIDRAALSALRASSATVEDWQRILAVYAGDDRGLPMIGTYAVDGDTLLRFRPRFPPVAGVLYTARYDRAALYDRIGRPSAAGPPREVIATWRPAVSGGASSTLVRAVYPSAAEVPMNLLRMYVEFSAPMSTGRAYDHIRMYADGDSLLEEPFFTAGGAVELWDPDKTRLTILFDPGRIKRDLKPNEQLGLPLREGGRYRLVIDSAWRDARGRTLVRAHEKRFRVRGMDRSLVRTADWKVMTPRVGTRDSLVLSFPEPLDRALLARLLVVRDSAGKEVAGAVAIGARERRWTFAPVEPWRAAPYFVDVDTELEDLAGNNLRKLFDVAPSDSASSGATGSRVRIGFAPS